MLRVSAILDVLSPGSVTTLSTSASVSVPGIARPCFIHQSSREGPTTDDLHLPTVGGVALNSGPQLVFVLPLELSSPFRPAGTTLATTWVCGPLSQGGLSSSVQTSSVILVDQGACEWPSQDCQEDIMPSNTLWAPNFETEGTSRLRKNSSKSSCGLFPVPRGERN